MSRLVLRFVLFCFAWFIQKRNKNVKRNHRQIFTLRLQTLYMETWEELTNKTYSLCRIFRWICLTGHYTCFDFHLSMAIHKLESSNNAALWELMPIVWIEKAEENFTFVCQKHRFFFCLCSMECLPKYSVAVCFPVSLLLPFAIYIVATFDRDCAHRDHRCVCSM